MNTWAKVKKLTPNNTNIINNNKSVKIARVQHVLQTIFIPKILNMLKEINTAIEKNAAGNGIFGLVFCIASKSPIGGKKIKRLKFSPSIKRGNGARRNKIFKIFFNLRPSQFTRSMKHVL